MKVYIGCFGSGLGHASRMLEIAKELKARGSGVRFSSSGEVAEMIRARGYECNALPLADVKYSEEGEFLVKESLAASPVILGRAYRQVASEVRNIGSYSPDVVLSDSALPTVLAARILRLPTYTVLNQLNLTSSHTNMGAPSRLLSVGISAGMGKLWEFSDEVILPDLPPPYTISEKNLWGSNVEKTRYVGFLAPSDRGVPDEAFREFASDSRPKVFWQVSGPPKTRTAFLRIALDCSKSLSKKYAFVVSGGDPSAIGEATKSGGVWYYQWCAIAELYFEACDVIIARGGHGTVGQAILSSKPSLLVPIPNQPEQEGNAEKAERLGVSILLPQDRLTTATLAVSLDELLRGSHQTASQKLGSIARNFDAKREIVDAIEASAMRARQGLR
jgi:UDP:flavonoid glycosyltransferase YjiC (YdhE family)